MTRVSITAIGSTVGFYAALLCTTLVFAHSENQERALLQNIRFDQHLGAQIPAGIRFTDSNGSVFSLDDLNGKPAILVLSYYRCKNLCSTLLNGIVKSVDDVPLQVGRDFSVISLSIDPAETTATAADKKHELLRRYSIAGTDASWHFLTGSEEAIHKVADTIGFHYIYDPEEKEYLHAAGIVLLTPERRVSRYFYGVDFPPRDVTFGLIDASADTIGPALDRALVRCFHYDVLTGRYSLAIVNVLRVACAALVLFMLIFIGCMLLRDRTRPDV